MADLEGGKEHGAETLGANEIEEAPLQKVRARPG